MTTFGKSLVWVCVAVIAIGGAFVMFPDEIPEPIIIQSPLFLETNDETPTQPVVASSTPYLVTGYYSTYEWTIYYDDQYGGTTTCDAFVTTRNDNPLTEYMWNLVNAGNTVNSILPNGDLRLNLDFRMTNPSTVEKIKSSSPERPVQILLSRKIQEAKDAPPCSTFVDIVE